MGQFGMLGMASGSTRRRGWVAAGAAVVTVAVPMAASASAGGAEPRAHSAATVGAVYGGFTTQDFPVVVVMNKSRRRVVRAGIGIRTSCTSGGIFTVTDGYQDLKISKKGRFSGTFSDTDRNADGTTTDAEGSVTGALNKARTKVKGTWTIKVTDHDAAGAVTDTCDGGTIRWTATQ
jgi:hypothetical protein